MQYLGFFIIIIILASLIKFFEELNKTNQWEYRKKDYFFSYSELKFFESLKFILEKNFWNKYWIFPKVRLADIFETKKQGNLNKIRAKHIDYLIVNLEKHCDPVLAIELNWKSHFSFSMKKSDNFKRETFKNAWLPLIYFFNNEKENLELIEREIKTIILWNSDTPWKLDKSITIN